MENGNPYAGGMPVSQPRNGAVAVRAAHAAAEVWARIVPAKQFPRDEAKSIDRILKECSRTTVAEQAVYSFPRSDVTVTGPSVRLAGAVARSRGNIAPGFTAAERSENESAVIIRRTRKGDYAITDDRDICELEANRAARWRRARIPAIIPGDVVDAAVERCRRTLDASIGDRKDARNKTVESFGAFGVTKEMIERRIGRRIDAIRPGEIVAPRGIFNSLKDGTVAAGGLLRTSEKTGGRHTPSRTAAARRDPTGRTARHSRRAAGDGLPEACGAEIAAALAADERDVNKLPAPLEKAEAARADGRG
jgi:hypothetical protein